MEKVQFIQVILPLRLEWRPWYYVPSEIGPAEPGEKVSVVFAYKKYIGVVCNTSCTAPDELDAAKIKAIESIERNLAPVSPKQLQLWEQLAGYYMCTIGEVFRTAFPAFRLDMEEIEARKRQRIEAREAKLKEIEARKKERLEAHMSRLEARLAKLEALIEKSRNPERKARYITEYENIKTELTESRNIVSAAGTNIPPAGTTTINGDTCRTTAAVSGATDTTGATTITLSPAQQKAFDGIKAAFIEKRPAVLDGVTGSGKTEIYMKIASETLQNGKNVLYLVPEIALSRQLEQRLEKVFGESLLIFHSHESTRRRGEVASIVAGGMAWHATDRRTAPAPYIVLGTRSALFLPHHDLGLIVVDEEHDSSYKQDSPAPRYNGRDVAAMLAQIEGSRLIFGSATPSLEAIYNCSTGRYAKIKLSERYHGESEVGIEVIDTKAERRKRGMHGSFSRKLIAHIGDTLAEGRQVLILRARRSYAPAVQCSICGDIPKCPRCNISLSLHKTLTGDRLVCHHCGNSFHYDGKCGICGNPMEHIGAGTQKIWEEACQLFPDAKVDRIDSDVSRRPEDEKAAVENFSKGRTDILVGTQMISKGFDFERLGLVAVIQADTLLSVQDFRADEKAFQLLEQFRGRCARRGGRGLFVIQTSMPEYPLFKRLDDGIAPELLMERKRFGYPPYFRLVVLQVRDKFADRADRFTAALASEICMALGPATEKEIELGDGVTAKAVSVVGPYTPPRETQDGKYLRELRISLARTKRLAEYKQLIYNTINMFTTRTKYDGTVSIDVDPS